MAKKLTDKQRKFISHKIEGKSSRQAALDAGYSINTAINATTDILASPAVQDVWLKTLEMAGITEDAIAKKIKEGLDAHKIHGTDSDFIEVPDFSTRHKYVETSLEQLGRKNKDSVPQFAFFQKITVEKENYGI
ncbi:MAG: terminase small subunit [Candidatus Berkelbacteria bacterium]|nr:terminase small subunit [Candidatus Berkelbacteria bacterium]